MNKDLFENNRFVAIVSWYRQTRSRLSPSDWEDVVARLDNSRVIGGSEYMADVVTNRETNNVCRTVKTLVTAPPQTSKGKQAWIIYARDPDQLGLDLLAEKCTASLNHFDCVEMDEWIITHEEDPKDPDYYVVAVYCRPQIDWKRLTLKVEKQSKEETTYSLNGDKFLIQKSPSAKREQSCLKIRYQLQIEDALFHKRIYAPVYIPTTNKMVELYESRTDQC